MKNLNKNIFKTKDQYIASTLYTLGAKLHSTEWSGRECFFVFENLGQCKKIVTGYFSGELLVDPRILFDSFKTIKTILFNK